MATKTKPAQTIYTLCKGGASLYDARVNKQQIRLFVNGPGMLFASVRLLTTLSAEDGATAQNWKKLAAALKCTSLCGFNGKTEIPVEVQISRIGAHIEFSLGPMAMYQSVVMLRPKAAGKTLKQVIDAAFGAGRKSYSVMLEPLAATGHAEHGPEFFTRKPGDTPAPHGDEHAHHAGGH